MSWTPKCTPGFIPRDGEEDLTTSVVVVTTSLEAHAISSLPFLLSGCSELSITVSAYFLKEVLSKNKKILTPLTSYKPFVTTKLNLDNDGGKYVPRNYLHHEGCRQSLSPQ